MKKKEKYRIKVIRRINRILGLIWTTEMLNWEDEEDNKEMKK